MKKYLFCMFIGFSFFTHAQDTSKVKKITMQVNVGALFLNFESNTYGTIQAEYNTWNAEFYIEENKLGIGLLARYIPSREFIFINLGKGYIKNPFFKPRVRTGKTIFTLQLGDLVEQYQDFSGFSFLLNKRLLFSKRHRLDLGIGTQHRVGYLYYFAGYLSS